MLTFAEIRDSVMALFDVIDDTGTDLTVTNDAINRTHARRVDETNWRWNLSPRRTLLVVSGTQTYILPFDDISRFHYFRDTTNKVFLSVVPGRSYEDQPFNEQTANDNIRLALSGWSPVKAQPSSATTLTITSTVAEDGAQTLYIEGTDADDNVVSESVLNNGTTTNSYERVTYVAKVGTWAGTLTLATTGGTTLLVLSASQNAKQYPTIEFVNPPSETFTVEYRYFKRARVLTRDNDIPDLPYPMSNILIYDALLELATYNELDSESVNIWREKQREWLDNMYLSTLEGNTVGGVTERIHEGF